MEGPTILAVKGVDLFPDGNRFENVGNSGSKRGQGTNNEPGIRWWFEYVREKNHKR